MSTLPAHTGLIELAIDIRADADPVTVGNDDIAWAVEFLDDALAAIACA